MRHESQPLPPGGIGIFRGALKDRILPPSRPLAWSVVARKGPVRSDGACFPSFSFPIVESGHVSARCRSHHCSRADTVDADPGVGEQPWQGLAGSFEFASRLLLEDTESQWVHPDPKPLSARRATGLTQPITRLTRDNPLGVCRKTNPRASFSTAMS